MRRRRLTVKNRKKLIMRLGLLILAALLVIGLIVGGILLFTGSHSSTELEEMAFSPEDLYIATGTGILSLTDGQLTYRDLSDKGKNYSLSVASEGVKLSGYGSTAVVYNAAAMQIVGASAPVEFSGQVMDVKCGSSYVAVMHISASGATSLLLYNIKGNLRDELSFEGQYLIDFGFYGTEGNLLWTLELDTTGSIPNSTLTTYDLNKGTTTGVIPIQGQLPEHIEMTSASTYVCGTNSLIRYQDSTEAYRILVYGWELLDVSTATGKPMFLYTPRDEDGYLSVAEIRTVAEADVASETKRQIQLQDDAFAAFLSSGRVVSFTPSGAVIAAADGTKEKMEFPFTAESSIKLDETHFLVLGGGSVWMVTL